MSDQMAMDLMPRSDVGTLYTFGYSKAKELPDLQRMFDGKGIDLVVDVRLRRFTYRRPWSHGTSSTTVAAAGARYLWEPGLGNELYKSDDIRIADMETIEPSVLDHLREGSTVAIMCTCYAATDCHRRVVAREAALRLPGLEVRDL